LHDQLIADKCFCLQTAINNSQLSQLVI